MTYHILFHLTLLYYNYHQETVICSNNLYLSRIRRINKLWSNYYQKIRFSLKHCLNIKIIFFFLIFTETLKLIKI